MQTPSDQTGGNIDPPLKELGAILKPHNMYVNCKISLPSTHFPGAELPSWQQPLLTNFLCIFPEGSPHIHGEKVLHIQISLPSAQVIPTLFQPRNKVDSDSLSDEL